MTKVKGVAIELFIPKEFKHKSDSVELGDYLLDKHIESMAHALALKILDDIEEGGKRNLVISMGYDDNKEFEKKEIKKYNH
jgi:hypothetical protein